MQARDSENTRFASGSPSSDGWRPSQTLWDKALAGDASAVVALLLWWLSRSRSPPAPEAVAAYLAPIIDLQRLAVARRTMQLSAAAGLIESAGWTWAPSNRC